MKSMASRDAYRVLVPNAIGQLVGGLESLWSIKNYRPNGFLRGRAAKRSDRSFISRPIRQAIDTTAGAVVIHSGSVAGSIIILASRNSRAGQLIGTAISLASNQLAQYRNPYGRDGSDQMSSVIYSYRLASGLVRIPQKSDDLFLRAINAQTCVAYTASGLSKLISSTWRSGDALGLIFATSNYGGTVFARFIEKNPWSGKLISWGTIAWESSFPLVYSLDAASATRCLNLVKVFHAGIAVSMGLPRFFWGFAASHIAVEYVIKRRGIEN